MDDGGWMPNEVKYLLPRLLRFFSCLGKGRIMTFSTLQLNSKMSRWKQIPALRTEALPARAAPPPVSSPTPLPQFLGPESLSSLLMRTQSGLPLLSVLPHPATSGFTPVLNLPSTPLPRDSYPHHYPQLSQLPASALSVPPSWNQPPPRPGWNALTY